MLLANFFATVWDCELLETLDRNTTLLTKISSTIFVLVVVGSLLLSLTLERTRNASYTILRARMKEGDHYNHNSAYRTL